jgi:acyl transferase domain-containing protein/thioesterase domain-containing protein
MPIPNPSDSADAFPDTAIAIVGTACHLPGACNYSEFWNNLRNGVESVSFFSDDELLAAGIPASRLSDPNYVKASPILDRVAGFDPAFWGISPKDAAIMDPQHRHFLECAYEALEDCGHDSQRFDGTIGVFGGCGANSYLMHNLLTNPPLMDSVGPFLIRHTSNDKDFLTSFTSYKLGLEGPSVGVQTACSTSLVAIHIAAQHLINGECDMALAGGSTIEIPHVTGYRFEEGEILSPDGHCRPFDAGASGTVFGSGTGVVVLRRLRDALESGDTIRAVLRGSAVNNDGSRKAGFLAPSVDGNAHVVAEALAISETDAGSISYVETHGTGTPVGDPIEIAALTQAFRETSQAKNFCGIGSCKSNIGHIDSAAGVASFLKVVEALRHEQLPPSLHFDKANPLLEIDSSPFYVNAELKPWPRGSAPRRAGVHSTGVGGTNAHVILEEAPLQKGSTSTRAVQLLALAAKTRGALDAMCARLADHLEQDSDLDLADVAYTLQMGRRELPHRRTLVCRSTEEAIVLLRDPQSPKVKQGLCDDIAAEGLAFLMPGGGAQYAQMARDLYQQEADFRASMDRGFALLQERHNLDLKPLLLAEATAEVSQSLEKPSLQLPAIFLVEVALAQLWISWGIKPSALLGHSLGENSAACIAGIFSYEDALGLVVLRGRLFETLPAGAMLSVELAAEPLQSMLPADLVIGVHNTPNLCVVSGPPESIATLRTPLQAQEIECQAIEIDCAAHSPMLEPILQEFGDYLRSISLHPPTIPLISNRTGCWLSDAEATDPEYWVSHLRHPVQFADGVELLLQDSRCVLLEVGPGKALASLVRLHPAFGPKHTILSSLRHRDEKVDDLDFLCGVLGLLWNAGLNPDWQAFHNQEPRLRLPLPTYPFERQDYWIEPGKISAESSPEQGPITRLESLDDWLTTEKWLSVALPPKTEEAQAENQRWLLFVDQHGCGRALAERLRSAGHEVITVREGDTYYRFSNHEFALSPEAGRRNYDDLIGALAAEQRLPDRIVHLWTVTSDKDARPGSSMFHHNKERGFFSLFFLAQALGEIEDAPSMQLDAISNGLYRVLDADVTQPEKALLLGPIRVMPREYSFLEARSLDLDWIPGDSRVSEAQLDVWMKVLSSPPETPLLAIRDGQIFAPTSTRLLLTSNTDSKDFLPERGVVLITGGLGGLGLTIAEHYAQLAKARLVLLGRSPFPAESKWDSWLAIHTKKDATSQIILRLRAMQRLGAEVLIAQADVANLEEMRAAMELPLQRFGPLDGVIHAAGVLEDGVIQMRTPEAVERVFTPKVHGTWVLRDLLRDQNLKFFLLCSSTSVALAPVGQVDYVAANAFLNALAASERGKDGPPLLALNWGIWSEVGMASELAARLHGELPLNGERLRLDGPWFTERMEVSPDQRVWRGPLNAKQNWLLNEHRLQNGLAVMPGAAYLGLALNAFSDWQGPGPAVLEDVQFHAACEVHDDAPQELSLSLKRVASGFEFEICSRAPDSRAAWLQHASGRISRSTATEPECIDLSGLQKRAREHLQEVQTGALPDPQDRYLAFGPRFQTHQRIGYYGTTAYARLQLSAEFLDDLEAIPLHPALLDIGTGCALDLLPGYDPSDAMFVPLRYGRLEYFAPLSAELHCRLSVRPGDTAAKEIVNFQIDLCDPSGKILVTVQDLQLRRLEHHNRFAAGVNPASHSARNTDSPAERAFFHALKAGIDAPTGMKALDRVLGAAASAPAILTVSSMDMDTLALEQDRAVSQLESGSSVKFERPNLSSDYLEPADAIEKQLAEWWQDLLGVGKVGVMDDFFEVGGHSLVAVRLFTRIKKKWSLEYPLSLLFEAPTIRLCADILREEITTEKDGTGAVPNGQTPARKQSNRYLVPLNDVRNSSLPPFFLVAGMFGNVLNLRHLSAHLGSEQPVYAVQARGLHGDDRPHHRFEDMARDYLVEIRKIQPNGPYLLGGFSGGGLTAFEMAQQLEAAGEKTAALIMLDSPITYPPHANALERMLIRWMKLRRGGLRFVAEWPRKRIAWEFEKRRLKRSAHEMNLAPAEFRSELIREGFVEALAAYELRPYFGRMTIFRPPLDRTFVLPRGRLADVYGEIQHEHNHWDPYTPGGIDCFEVPGDHDSMVLEPHVRVLGAKVCEVLRKAQESMSVQPDARH